MKILINDINPKELRRQVRERIKARFGVAVIVRNNCDVYRRKNVAYFKFPGEYELHSPIGRNFHAEIQQAGLRVVDHNGKFGNWFVTLEELVQDTRYFERTLETDEGPVYQELHAKADFGSPYIQFKLYQFGKLKAAGKTDHANFDLLMTASMQWKEVDKPAELAPALEQEMVA